MKRELLIYIPTRGRVDRQLTLQNLSKEWRARTILVCPKNEIKEHARNWPDLRAIRNVPFGQEEIAAKRAWIFRNAESNKIIQLDDDLRFRYRKRVSYDYEGFDQGDPRSWKALRENNPILGQLREGNDSDVKQMFKRIEQMLDRYVHGGISVRFMNHNCGHEFKTGTRALHALAFRVDAILDNCELNRLRYMEDYDYTLQLFSKGYNNAIYYWGATEEPLGQNAPGGVSLYKTKADGIKEMKKLCAFHPGIASYDHRGLRIAWSKAIAQGRLAT